MSVSVTLGTLAALAIVIMVNYLAATRLEKRIDLDAHSRIQLSPLTVATLKVLTNEVRVVMLYSADSDLFPQVRGMLREYARLSPHIHVEHIDYNRQPAVAEAQKNRFHLASSSGDVVIFEASVDRYRLINENEMSTFDADVGAMLAGKSKEIRRTGFRGEMLFTSAVAALSEASQARGYFIVGHGSRRPDNQEDQTGYKVFANLLEERNVSWSMLTNVPGSIPKDCQLLVITGPTETMMPAETTAIGQYLQGGGRALILLDTATAARTGPLEHLVEEWGVELPPQQAADEQNSAGGLDVATTQFANHPITGPLVRSEAEVVFPWPRVVAAVPEKAQAADAPKATVIISTGPKGKTKSQDADGSGSFTYSAARDFTGEVPLAVAVEHGAVTGVNASPTTTRLVVIGDSLIFANTIMKNSGNHALASLAVGWLLDRSQTLAIGPRPLAEYRLSLTQKKIQLLTLFMAGILPGIAILTGIAVWLRRRV